MSNENPYLKVVRDLASELISQAYLWEEAKEAKEREEDQRKVAGMAAMLRYLRQPALTEEERRAHREHGHFRFTPAEDSVVEDGERPVPLAFVPPYEEGRHASDEDTDPDMGATGRRATGEEK